MKFVLNLLPVVAFSFVNSFKYSLIDEKSASYSLPELPYPLNGLEPWIEEKTVDVHYNGHHRAYANNMNAALQRWKERKPSDNLHQESIAVILERLDEVPEEYRTPIKNHGGGFVNHLFYWFVMGPNHGAELKTPSNKLLQEITQYFGSYDDFKSAFVTQAKSLFGSGYVWLVRNKQDNSLEIISTVNQDCPLTNGQYPILVIDVWEHAYYLDHKNKRPDYINNWSKLVDWEKVDELDEYWVKRNTGRDEL